MEPYFHDDQADLYLGDSVEVMATIPECSIDAVVTDPPYGIRFMGKAWDGVDIERRIISQQRKGTPITGMKPAKLVHEGRAFSAGTYDLSRSGNKAFEEWTQVWASEALRVLKPGGYLVSFASPRTFHRMVCGIEDAGFEIRDTIMWVFGSGFPKSKNLTGDYEGWGTALKPGYEPIVLARKPLIGTVEQNVNEHGTGAMNIDECRVPANGEELREGAGYIPCRHDEKQSRRPGENSADRSYKHNGATDFGMKPGVRADGRGRWPANLIHDGSAEVVALFPHQKSGAMAAGVARRGDVEDGKVCYGRFGGDTVAEAIEASEGSASRFFYCAKASKADRDEGLDMVADRVLARSCQAQAEAERGNVVEAAAGAFNQARLRKNHHPTVKPTDLMRYLVRLVTPREGVVLDCFAGSGSTGKAALLEEFRFIGIDAEEEYLEVAAGRLIHALKQVKQLEFGFLTTGGM